MPGGAVAAVTTIATAGAGYASAQSRANAAGDAAGAQVDAAREANATNLAIYRDQRNLSLPNARAGAEARARQMLMQGIPPAQVKAFLQQSASAFGASAPGSVDTPENLQARYPQVYSEWIDPGTDGIAGNRNRNPNFADFVASRGQSVAPVNGASAPGGGAYDDSWVDAWSYESTSPSYGFRKSEGEKAIERSAAARGKLFSGATGKALTRYGSDFAGTEFENDFRRLGSLSGAGDQATSDININAGQYGQSANANTMAAGRARASGYEQQGEAWGNFWQGAAGIPMYGHGQGWWGGAGKGK